jgi:hypothetical protein
VKLEKLEPLRIKKHITKIIIKYSLKSIMTEAKKYKINVCALMVMGWLVVRRKVGVLIPQI